MFKTHRCPSHCVVSWSKTLYPLLSIGSAKDQPRPVLTWLKYCCLGRKVSKKLMKNRNMIDSYNGLTCTCNALQTANSFAIWYIVTVIEGKPLLVCMCKTSHWLFHWLFKFTLAIIKFLCSILQSNKRVNIDNKIGKLLFHGHCSIFPL